ncbi:MAG: hypothetical protein QF879_07635 [Candidatus Latescibacteria bacterium]|jgi:protein phosphatase|nr:hypothetical protein [Candidatus Latescibacterota bacterium]|tara:strand:- start:290 stop:439 length:150 start_codon:yes stop_codon:yes gene_type:complete
MTLTILELSIKRSLPLREFALGIEALERFIRKEPLPQGHACVRRGGVGE